jgi:hypothetical protein
MLSVTLRPAGGFVRAIALAVSVVCLIVVAPTTAGAADESFAATACAGKKVCLCNPKDPDRCYAVFQYTVQTIAAGRGGWRACATQPGKQQVVSLYFDGGSRLFAESVKESFVSTDGCASWLMSNTN